MTKHIIIWLIAISIVSITAFHFYENYELKKNVIASVKKTSLKIEEIAQYELGINESITYADYFKELESAIQEIEFSANDVKNLALTNDNDFLAPSISYLNLAKEYCRAVLILNKNIFDAEFEMDRMYELIREKNRFEKSGYYDQQKIEKITNELNDVLRKRESLKTKTHDMRTSLKKLTIRMVSAHEDLGKYLPSSTLLDKTIYLKLTDTYKTD